MAASRPSCGRGVETLAVWLVFTTSFPLASGGRYSDPTEMAKYAVPFTISIIILIGMLGLLCYFKRRDISKRCPCRTGARQEMDITQNRHRQSNRQENVQVTVPTIMGCTASQCRHTGQTNGTLPPQHPHHSQNAERQKVAHSSCPGCGSPCSKDQGQIKDERSDNKKTTRTATKGFAAFFKSKKNPKGVSSNDKSDEFTEGKELTCENCFQMSLRKALKEQDITNVGLTLETSDACHI